MHKLKPEELKSYVLSKWAEQYGIDPETAEYKREDKEQHFRDWGISKLFIYRNIKAMPESPTVEQINNIIGNKEWTTDFCSFCGERIALTNLLQSHHFSNADWWVDDTATICEYCISAATDVIKLG